LVTGGCGFIGSNFIHRCFKNDPNSKIINLDAMRTGSNHLSVSDLQIKKQKNYRFVKGNICNKKLLEKLINNVDYVVNFAAESHVDRSISDPKPFLNSNIMGVYNILEILRKKKNKKDIKFLQISTDEVYGEKLKGNFSEEDKLEPSNPYSASKASAEMLINSYARTYDINAIITRCTNNFGPRQHIEKLIPKTIVCALSGIPIPIHGSGKYKRQWIYVNDHCDALLKIISKWKSNSSNSSIYNICGNYETTNLNLVKKILTILEKPYDLIKFVSNRPGQDHRYALDCKKLMKFSKFEAKTPPQDALEYTVNWYIENHNWWKKFNIKNAINPVPWQK
jgi:dTDP-glucose 4,6-dehydratase